MADTCPQSPTGKHESEFLRDVCRHCGVTAGTLLQALTAPVKRGFDWSDYVRRREGLGNHAVVALTDAEADAFRRGDYPPPPSGMQRHAGMGEQPSIINRDPGDESRAEEAQDGFTPMTGRELALVIDLKDHIASLEAEKACLTTKWQFWHGIAQAHMTQGSRIAELEAENARLRMAAAPSTAPTPPPHNQMANALAHSEPKPAWPR